MHLSEAMGVLRPLRDMEGPGSTYSELEALRVALKALDDVSALHRRREWGPRDSVRYGQTEFPDLCDHCRIVWPCLTAKALWGDNA